MADAFSTRKARRIDASVDLQFKLLNDRATLPARQSDGAVGFDIHAAEDKYIHPGEWAAISTGLQLANVVCVGTSHIPVDIQIRPRSGLAAKVGVTVLNAPGTVDPDYRGEIKVLLINHGQSIYAVQQGDRIAQMVVAPFLNCSITATSQVRDTTRGAGGFGSTGK